MHTYTCKNSELTSIVLNLCMHGYEYQLLQCISEFERTNDTNVSLYSIWQAFGISPVSTRV